MTPAELTGAIDDRLRAVASRLGPRLRPRFDALTQRQGWLTGDSERYTHAASQPVVGLPMAVAQAFGLSDELLLHGVESGMVGYASVRVHDDWLDEGLGDDDPHATALLSHALFARHQTATAAAAGDVPAFWTFFDRTWTDYGEAMLLERDLLVGPDGGAGTYDAAAFDRVLLRSRPLAIPPAALLARAGELRRLPALVEMVDGAVKASQLLDDSVDLLEEFDAGRFNHLVQRFGGLHGREALLIGWALGGFATALEEADRALDAAAAAAEEVGIAPWFDRFVQARRSLVEAIRSKATLALGGQPSFATPPIRGSTYPNTAGLEETS
jgi:hypothetical protein